MNVVADNQKHFDVVVVGGGPAGLVAAVQSARAGARTLLIEKSGMLGGTTTLSGVRIPGIFHAWGRQVIAGIGWELIEETQRLTGRAIPDFTAPENRKLKHWEYCINVNVPVYTALADRLVVNSGCTLWLHTMLAEASFIESESAWTLQVCQKEGLKRITSHILIDCSGDANAVTLAGLKVIKSEIRQPGTLVFRLSGYDFGTLDLEALEAAFQIAVSEGRMERSDIWASQSPVTALLRNGGGNAMHVTGIDAATSEGKTAAELQARSILLRIVHFLRSQPGLEGLTVDYLAPECGIRETVTIDGELCISGHDYISGRSWEDSLCYSFFPIDIHNSKNGGVDTRVLEEGVVPTIPLKAQLPKESRQIIVAGRSICSDREANSALRVQATAMATGQVAGAASVLAANEKCDLRDVPIADIRRLLKKYGAIIPQANLI